MKLVLHVTKEEADEAIKEYYSFTDEKDVEIVIVNSEIVEKRKVGRPKKNK